MFPLSKWKMILCVVWIIATYYLFCIVMQHFGLDVFDESTFNHERFNSTTNQQHINQFKHKNSTSTPSHCTTQNIDIGQIHNCSNTSDKNIGIISLHTSEADKYYNLSMILNNHISYTAKYRHIYFEITKYVDEHIANLKLRGHNKKSKKQVKRDKILLSKISLIYNLLIEYKNALEYLLMIDFDVLFWNCSQTINSILQKSEQMYNKNTYDMIFAHGPDSIINSGIILFKNTNWTLSFLKSMKPTFLRFAVHINKINPGWGDQNVYIAMLMGYKNQKLLEEFNHFLMSDPFWNSSIIETNGMVTIIDKNVTTRDTNGTWNRLTNHNVSLDLHFKIDLSLQNHVCILTPMDMNFGYKFFRNKYIREKIEYEPFIMHFAGPGQKPYLQNIQNRYIINGKPIC
eukprot:158043_1